MPKLTISIVTANNKKLILDCLQSIYGTTRHLDFETYVVINHSEDDSETAIREQFPDVQLIVNEVKRGFTHNHNMVMRRGEGDYFLVLNDDTVFLGDALNRMVDYMDAAPDVGILGCKILNTDLSLQWSCGKSFTDEIEHFKSGVLRSLLPFLPLQRFADTEEVGWVSGACMLARAAAVREVGLLDESIVIYYEDGDWCWRMKKAGWKVVYFPHAAIVHHFGKTREKHLFRDLNIIYESRYYFFKKHYSRSSLIFIKSMSACELWFRSLKGLLRFFLKPASHRQNRESIRAYWTIFWRTMGLDIEVPK